MKQLLIGCGKFKDKQMWIDNKTAWEELTTLDINPNVNPDIIWDLNNLPLPFDDKSFDEIHAYQVLEHIGSQGDYMCFFKQFKEFYRILKDGGKIFISVPDYKDIWACGDPGHTRAMPLSMFLFLDQNYYIENDKNKTSCSDYRFIWKDNFQVAYQQCKDQILYIILQKK